MNVFPPGYVSAVNPTVQDPCNFDQEGQNGVDLGPGWAWGSMIMPQMDQVPLYNSVNFSLSVAYAQNNTCSTTLLNCFICPSDGGPSLVPVLGNPPDPANPGLYNGSTVVDTVARGNYVGMFGLGEICAALRARSLASFIPAIRSALPQESFSAIAIFRLRRSPTAPVTRSPSANAATT